MKTSKHLSAKAAVLCVVTAGLVWVSTTVTAQTFTILKSFGNLTNISGYNPQSQLLTGICFSRARLYSTLRG